MQKKRLHLAGSENQERFLVHSGTGAEIQRMVRVGLGSMTHLLKLKQTNKKNSALCLTDPQSAVIVIISQTHIGSITIESAQNVPILFNKI